MIQNIFVAHSELLSASENLLQLADWCDQNFSPEEAPTDEVRYFPESKLPKKFFGGNLGRKSLLYRKVFKCALKGCNKKVQTNKWMVWLLGRGNL